MATSFSGGRSQSTWREPPNTGKQLVGFITCGCESSAPFLQSRVRTHNVLVIGLYEACWSSEISIDLSHDIAEILLKVALNTKN
jgi:hypothetical protein